MLVDLELHTYKILLPHISVIFHIQYVVSMSFCLEWEIPQHVTNSLSPQSSGMEEKGPANFGQLFDPALKNCILVVRSHPAVAYLLYTGMYCPLEQGICGYYFVRPVGEDSGPLGGCQELVGFLGLENFPRWGSSHEVIISVVQVVVHKYGGYQ